jgi:hypothetical protein
MTNMIPIHVTIDHDVIRTWAQRRNGRPSTFLGDERPWPIRFEFGAPSPDAKEIGWEEFFVEFERANLAFVYRDVAEGGEPDDFHEFVNRAVLPELTLSSKSTVFGCVV